MQQPGGFLLVGSPLMRRQSAVVASSTKLVVSVSCRRELLSVEFMEKILNSYMCCNGSKEVRNLWGKLYFLRLAMVLCICGFIASSPCPLLSLVLAVEPASLSPISKGLSRSTTTCLGPSTEVTKVTKLPQCRLFFPEQQADILWC